jgi:hypothetical protein
MSGEDRPTRYGRLKVKGREAGVYSALQLEEAGCTLTPWRSSLIHLQRRHHSKRHESPLLAKEGTFIEGILLAIRNSLQLLGSFKCRKSGTWDRLFNFPSEGRHAEDFVQKKVQRLRPGLNPRIMKMLIGKYSLRRVAHRMTLRHTSFIKTYCTTR